jgi:hypothetical protein
VIVVVGDVGVVMIAVPGLPVWAVHIPIPVAAIVAVPPGSTVQATIWSGPASAPLLTVTIAVSLQAPLEYINKYVPVTLNVVMVVVGEAGLVIIAVPGLPGDADHVPAPVAAIVTEPPGSATQLTDWSGPALGPLVIVTVAVSVQLPLVHMKLYIPGALKVVIVVVGDEGAVIMAVPGFPVSALQVPMPVAAIVTDPPGKATQLAVWSGPAFGLAVTVTAAVSEQLPLVYIKS